MLKLDWLFSTDAPLPTGLKVEEISNALEEQNLERRAGMAALLGEREAVERLRKLGRYELSDETARVLGLAGVKLGRNGEFPAMSPEQWVELPKRERWEAMKLRLQEGGGRAVGLQLDSGQTESFLKFLARHRVEEGKLNDPLEMIALARHFFFSEPLRVVVAPSRPVQ